MAERKHRRQMPAGLAVLAALAVLLTLGEPRGAAVSSPVEGLAERPLAKRTAAVRPQSKRGPASTSGGPVEETPAVPDAYFEDAVFLGDSRTEGFYLYSGLRTGSYFYAVGATVESVFSKAVWKTPEGKIPLLDALAAAEFNKVYLMLGVNELGWPQTEDFRDQYGRVIDRIRQDHPEAEIVLQSILPVSAAQEAKGTYVNNGRIRVYNQVIQELAAEKDCAFVNVAESVTDAEVYIL